MEPGAVLRQPLRVATVSPSQWSSKGARNFEAVRRLVDSGADRVDVLVLPELVGGDDIDSVYERLVCELAQWSGCWVIGGSHHQRLPGGRRRNRGVVSSPTGTVVSVYEKRYPFDSELREHVTPGTGPVAFDSPWGAVGVAICADLFHFETIAAMDVSLLAVPSFSITSRDRAAAAAAIWRHLTITRSYELGAFVVVSDWAESTAHGKAFAVGVSGIADPAANDPATLHRSIGGAVATWGIDVGRLDALHQRRAQRGFLVRPRPRCA